MDLNISYFRSADQIDYTSTYVSHFLQKQPPPPQQQPPQPPPPPQQQQQQVDISPILYKFSKRQMGFDRSFSQ